MPTGKAKSGKPRAQVKDLPSVRKLSGKELKKVKGGDSLTTSGSSSTAFNPKEFTIDMPLDSTRKGGK